MEFLIIDKPYKYMVIKYQMADCTSYLIPLPRNGDIGNNFLNLLSRSRVNSLS